MAKDNLENVPPVSALEKLWCRSSEFLSLEVCAYRPDEGLGRKELQKGFKY